MNLNQTPNDKLVKIASQFAILTAFVLIVFKFWAWRTTQSMGLQASLIDSLLDMGASVINFFVIKTALKPADAQHRFGHGKAEALGSIGQSIFIAASALWLLVETVERLIHPVPIQDPTFGSKVMILAIILSAILVAFQSYVVRRTKSLAIESDCLHYKSDIYLNLGVLISLNVSQYLNWIRLDACVGGLLAIYILYSSWLIAHKGLKVLMDHELPDEDRHKILNIALQHPDVLGIHELKTRSSGKQQFIQMHLELDQNLSLLKAHEIGEMVSTMIKAQFIDAEIIIHQDPVEKNQP